MTSKNLTACDQIMSYVTTLSSSASNWSAETQSAYGDFAATHAPELSFDFDIKRQDLEVDQVFTYVGFEYRNESGRLDRCERSFIYPVGICLAEKIRSPGSSSPTGATIKASRSDVENFMRLTEELEVLLYDFRSDEFGVESIEASFDPTTVGKQFLKSMIMVGLADA